MKVTSIHSSSKTKYIWVLKNWHWHNFQTHCLLVHYAMFLYNPTTKFCGPDVSTLALYPLIIQKCPPDNKTSWRRSIDVSLYVPGMLQVRLKSNTQRRLSGTSPRRLSGTSSQRLIGMSWWHLMGTQWQRPISKSTRRLKQGSNETPNDVSVVHHQDVSVVHIHYVPLVCLCNVFCNSQTKHPITSLWYVSTTSWSYIVARPCL